MTGRLPRAGRRVATGPVRRLARSRISPSGVFLSGLAVALGLTIATPPRPRLVWNVSASAPRGLYWVAPGVAIARGDMAIAHVPGQWRRLAARRRYLPAGVPLVKRVAAHGGDRVCATGAEIQINGRQAAMRRDSDGSGRALPRWSGCVTLGRGMVLLLNASRESFDGRYFGPSVSSDILGKAGLLWRA